MRTSAARQSESYRKSSSAGKPASFSNRGYGRFLSFPDTDDVTIDEARIKKAAKWDGLHAILIHSADDLDALNLDSAVGAKQNLSRLLMLKR